VFRRREGQLVFSQSSAEIAAASNAITELHGPRPADTAGVDEERPFVFSQVPQHRGFCDDIELDLIRMQRSRQRQAEEIELEHYRTQRARSLAALLIS
jgi:hypothetical protein